MKIYKRVALVATIAAIVLGMSSLLFADSVGWRMDGDGRYPDAEPPTAWGKDQNVLWKAPLSAWSNASPVLLEDQSKVIVLNEPDEILALSTTNGEVLWRDSTSDVVETRAGAHDANGWTTPTPVSDGAHIYVAFGSGTVASYSVAGERQWARLVQAPEHRWGHSASPVLAGGNLIVHVRDVFALDPKTGKELWRAESAATWGSPVVATIGGIEVVVTPSGDVFRADSGARVASEIGSLQFATPVVQGGRIYFIEKRATAVQIPKSIDEPFETVWESRLQGSRHYASPVLHKGLIYAVSREQQFSILDAATGELIHERQLDLEDETNSAYPSVTLAGDRIFLSSENGTTVVLEPGREYKELARNSVEGFRSSPVFHEKRMYIRAFEHLYCFGG